ncbi:molybdopterin biosynthesis protein, E chain [Lactiplantibacillus plantarum]|nr:molybdopterin biosynthesis protein, E chain [Lactiplantibacillus plantarum]
MAKIKLSATPLDVNALYQALKAPEYGGIVTFVGTVRQWTGILRLSQLNTQPIQKWQSVN